MGNCVRKEKNPYKDTSPTKSVTASFPQALNPGGRGAKQGKSSTKVAALTPSRSPKPPRASLGNISIGNIADQFSHTRDSGASRKKSSLGAIEFAEGDSDSVNSLRNTSYLHALDTDTDAHLSTSPLSNVIEAQPRTAPLPRQGATSSSTASTASSHGPTRWLYLWVDPHDSVSTGWWIADSVGTYGSLLTRIPPACPAPRVASFVCNRRWRFKTLHPVCSYRTITLAAGADDYFAFCMGQRASPEDCPGLVQPASHPPAVCHSHTHTHTPAVP